MLEIAPSKSYGAISLERVRLPLPLITKSLSRLLRHNPDGVLSVDRHGFVSVESVIQHLNGLQAFAGKLDRDHIEEALNDPHKIRFALSENGLKIRALSGHSFEVDLGYEQYVPTGTLYFGTTEEARDKIEEHGLTLSKKHFIRLVETFERAFEIAEARPGSGPMVIEVDAVALANDGHDFLLAENGEILCVKFDKKYLQLPNLLRTTFTS